MEYLASSFSGRVEVKVIINGVRCEGVNQRLNLYLQCEQLYEDLSKHLMSAT